MKIDEMRSFLDGRFPPALQEKYDNAGGQVLFPDDDLTGVLVSLDCDRAVIEEARTLGCNLIVSHHPFFFRPLRSLSGGEPRSEMLFDLVCGRTSLYAAHTNLDKIYYDRLGEVIGLSGMGLLLKSDPPRGDGAREYGFGVVGEFDPPLSLGGLLERVCERLSLKHLVYAGDASVTVRRCAVSGGAGGGAIERILHEHDVDCVITGDVGYHDVKASLDRSVPVIDAGHFGTERILLDFLCADIQDYLTKSSSAGHIRACVSRMEADPFRVYLPEKR
ncbi:MAG: Nif3-like dinuclear metal center hexameric protein [Spirochaetes bacterium]|jgi:dinuclear metal center YbgI/SA1388 family protein|nr:Nif3-like dinuclear metal center hexameric protein [Spirochaetota bacterium]